MITWHPSPCTPQSGRTYAIRGRVVVRLETRNIQGLAACVSRGNKGYSEINGWLCFLRPLCASFRLHCRYRYRYRSLRVFSTVSTINYRFRYRYRCRYRSFSGLNCAETILISTSKTNWAIYIIGGYLIFAVLGSFFLVNNKLTSHQQVDQSECMWSNFIQRLVRGRIWIYVSWRVERYR